MNYFKNLSEEQNRLNLKSEKVELGIVDNIKDSIDRGRKIENDLKSELNKYNGLLRAAGNFKRDYSKLVKQAKELGVDVPTELKKLEAIADGFEKKGEALKKVANLF